MRTPTARTKRFLEARGALVEFAEKWLPIPAKPRCSYCQTDASVHYFEGDIYMCFAHDSLFLDHKLPADLSIIPQPMHGQRKDLFECIDLLVVMDNRLIGIQSTSGSNHSKRMQKAKESAKLREYLSTGNIFEVWSWSKKGAKGKRKVWTPRVERLSLLGNATDVTDWILGEDQKSTTLWDAIAAVEKKD